MDDIQILKDSLASKPVSAYLACDMMLSPEMYTPLAALDGKNE